MGSAGSLSGSRADCPNALGKDVSSASLSSAVVPFSQTVLRVDVSCDLHPLFVHKLDAGPMQLATIAHAFNYRVAVLRDGVKSAIRVGRSRKAEGRMLTDTDVSWGHQVAVMFQILSTLALEVPTFLQNIEGLWGVSPNVQLYCEPYGHVDHSDANCDCLSSDRMSAYVHGLALMPRECLPVSKAEDASVHTEDSGARMSHAYCMGVGRPGSVPFVSHRPGAYVVGTMTNSGLEIIIVYSPSGTSESFRFTAIVATVHYISLRSTRTCITNCT